jgi:hypothetical protein
MEPLAKFLEEHPFWAVFLFVFMVLPIIGALVHIILKALGHKGIDNTITPVIDSDSDEENPDDAVQ